MNQTITIETRSNKDMRQALKLLRYFDFQDIRPMADTLNITDYMDKFIAEPGRILWIDYILEKFPVGAIRGSEDALINMVVPNDGFSYGEIRMKYDEAVKLAKKKVREYKTYGLVDTLRPYGCDSHYKNYLFGDNVEPCCQGDILWLGKTTLDNLINYGAYAKTEWIEKNWGSNNSENRTRLKINDWTYQWTFEAENTIMPLLDYISRDLDFIQFQSIYTFKKDSNSVMMVKPYDSAYYTEM